MRRPLALLIALSFLGAISPLIAYAEVLACKSRIKPTETRVIAGAKCPKGFRQLAALAESSEVTGLSLRTSMVSENHDAEPNTATAFTIQCPAGESAISGGYSISPETVSNHDSPNSVQAQTSQPFTDANGASIGWSVTFVSSSSQTRPVVVYAVCGAVR